MIKFSDFTYHRQDFFVVSGLFLVSLIGFWQVQLLLLPLLLCATAFVIAAFALPDFRQKWVPAFAWVDAALALILILEIVSYFFSIYPPNSRLGLDKMLCFILLYYFFRILLSKEKYKSLFFSGMGAYAFLLAVGAFMIFLLLQTQLKLEDWNDAAQFKRMFAPYALLNNEWATIALCLLPFPLLTAIYFRLSKIALIISAFAFAMVNAGILISFSRGAYLTLGLFWLILIIVIFLFKLLPVKILLQAIITVAAFTILLIVPIKTPFLTTLAMNKTVSQQRSTQGRMDIVQTSLCQAKAHLPLGVGANNFPIINDLCNTNREDQGYSGFTNNTYLQILLEKGIAGLAVYAFFGITLLLSIFKNLRRAQDHWQGLALALLLAGLITFAAREVFFSAFFYSNGVLLLVALLAGGAQSYEPVKIASIQEHGIWLIVSGLLIVTSGWMLFENAQSKLALQFATQSYLAWQSNQTSEAQQFAQKAIRLAPHAAPYPALKGLIIGQQQYDISITNSKKITTNQIHIPSAITEFEKALQINPYDAGYHFNLASLYYLNNDADTIQIFKHLNQALALEPNNTEYLVGAGLISEQLQFDTNASFKYYEKALRINPELLDAPFFADLQQRDSARAQQLLNKVTQQLQDQVNDHYNTIAAARLSKLFLAKGDTLAAKKLLQQVIQELPDLNRPYYHLAAINLQEKDTTLAINLLNKSVFLENTDYLPPLALGNLYFERRAANKIAPWSAIRYYRQALTNWKNEKTSHSARTAIKYVQHLNLDNDLILKNLLKYCNTALDAPLTLQHIAILYEQLGNMELAQHYKNLATKAPEDWQVGDLRE